MMEVMTNLSLLGFLILTVLLILEILRTIKHVCVYLLCEEPEPQVYRNDLLYQTFREGKS